MNSSVSCVRAEDTETRGVALESERTNERGHEGRVEENEAAAAEGRNRTRFGLRNINFEKIL